MLNNKTPILLLSSKWIFPTTTIRSAPPFWKFNVEKWKRGRKDETEEGSNWIKFLSIWTSSPPPFPAQGVDLDLVSSPATLFRYAPLQHFRHEQLPGSQEEEKLIKRDLWNY